MELHGVIGGANGTHGETINVYRLWVGKPEGKKICGRCSYRWENNIKMGFKKQDEWAWTGLIWLRAG
jgi:hypothetical protein